MGNVLRTSDKKVRCLFHQVYTILILILFKHGRITHATDYLLYNYLSYNFYLSKKYFTTATQISNMVRFFTLYKLELKKSAGANVWLQPDSYTLFFLVESLWTNYLLSWLYKNPRGTRTQIKQKCT